MKKLIVACFILFTMMDLNAQTQVLDNVLSVKVKGTGAIIKENNVMGYYSFYELDKKDRKTRVYQLSIYDQNLTALSSKKFTSQEKLTALEASYNGDLIMIKFYDEKEEKYVLKSYDQNAEQVGSKTLDADKVYQPFKHKEDEEGEEHTLTPIDGLGFVHFVVKTRKGVMSHTYNEITFIPNKKEAKSWTWTTPETSEDFESGDVLGSNGKTLLCLVNKRPKLMSKDIEDFALGIDIETGKKVYQNPLEDRKYSIATLNAVTGLDGKFQLFGLYFEKDAKTVKASSIGLFGFGLDPETGKVVTRKYESWEKDVSKFIKTNKNGKIEDIGHLFFHKFIVTSENKIFAVAEQFKTNVGASIGLSLLAGQTATTVNIGDFYLFEFDNTFDLKNVSVIDKTKSSYTFGAVTFSTRALGWFLDYVDAYDYAFTQVSKDKSKFSIGYIDYDKTKGEKGWYFGSINYSDGQFKSDKMKFDKKATWQHVYPGKPGYVMVTEYYRKEKKLDFRIEKLNF